MKRTPLKRTGFKSKKIAPGVKRMRSTRIKQVGKRKKREAKAEAHFRKAVKWRDKGCVICISDPDWTGHPYQEHYTLECWERTLKHIHAHHLCGKGRAGGHPEVHNPKNGVALCHIHHREVHEGRHPNLIKSRRWLDSLTKE